MATDTLILTLEVALVTAVLAAAGLAIWIATRQTKALPSALALANETLRHEIGERKRAEAELRAARDAAEAANVAKSRFLANVSHEIRTPLGAIMGFAELLQNPEQSAAERSECIATIRRNGEQLSCIINDILDLSKVEAGKLSVEPRVFDLAEAVADSMTLLGLQAREKGIELHVDYGDGVPLSVRSDPVRLKQILVNIVGNAIKFTSKGEVRVVITPTAPQKLAFVVVDTGVGISSALARTLFNPFAQGDASRTRTAGGTGLGLVLARRLANLLGGDVTLTSTEVGRGSTFTITIDPGPVVAAGRKLASVRQRDQDALFAPERGDAPGAPQPGYVALEALPRVMAAEGGSTPRLDGLRILLVDDSPDNQLLIRRILSLSGAHVEVANNGREGVEQIVKAQNGTPYDVVVMDIQMPVMDGYEAIAQIRSHGLELPVLALTAHALREEHDRCLASGFNSHLCKPINRAALLGTVFAHACKTSAAPHRETPLQEVTRTATAIT